MHKVHINLSDINLQMIVAMEASGGIGYKGNLPWPKNTKDLARFREITKDSVVVMGRKTFEEIESIRLKMNPETTELLPGRICVVVSSKNISSTLKIFVVKSLSDAVKYHYEECKPIFIIGGLQLYTEALPYVKVIHLTQFEHDYECDRHMPLKYMTKHFNIVEGTQEEGAVFLTCERVVL